MLSTVDEKAVDYAVLAAGKAQRRWANAEALALWEDAIDRLTRMPETESNRDRRIDAVIRQAEVRFALGQHTGQIEVLEGIRALVEAADPERRATWHYWTGFLHSLTGSRPETAIEHCQEASRIAEAHGLEEIRAYAETCLAQAYLCAGRLSDGLSGRRAGARRVREPGQPLVGLPGALPAQPPSPTRGASGSGASATASARSSTGRPWTTSASR